MNRKDPLSAKPEGTQLSRSAQRALEAAKRKAAMQQKILLILLAIALIINVVVAFVLYEQLVVEQGRESLARLTQEKVNERKSVLDKYISEQNKLIDEFANSPEIIAALDPAAEPEQLQQTALQLQEKIPAALNVRLIPIGTASLQREAEFPIRFAELDLIQRAEQRKPAQPELATIGEHQFLYLIRPIPTDPQTDPLGTFMVTLSAENLFAIFKGGDSSLGEYILQQQFSGTPPQVLKKVGAGSAGGSKHADVAGSYLQIKFTPSETLVNMSKELPTLWILIVSLVAAASLALAWFLSKVLVGREIGNLEPVQPLPEIVKTPKPAAAEANNLADPLFQNQDILDIAMIDEDENILGLNLASGKKPAAGGRATINEADVPAEIFRSYDIRGLVDSQITPELAQSIGQAIGSEALDRGEINIVVARDGRTHSEALAQALVRGILRTGCNVINIGVVPTPLMYFATFHFDDTSSGVMVTASHNPKEYNGFKVVMNNQALADDAVTELRTRILTQNFHQGFGEEIPRIIIADYIDRIFSDVALAGNVTMVVDAGNAVPGVVAPQLFEELGCDVIPLFCDLDGEFPNHDPDPTIEKNLTALIEKVQETNADIGVAFDGDGDRLVVVTPKGDIIWPDRLLMLFAKDILARNPGADV